MRKMLSDEQIIEIKEKYSSKLYTEAQLAVQYKCSIMTISLWLKDDPWSVIKKKTRVRQSDYIGRVRCSICGRVIDDLLGNIIPCDCQKPKKYYSGSGAVDEDVLDILEKERKSFYI